jgi:predicted RNA methylase
MTNTLNSAAVCSAASSLAPASAAIAQAAQLLLPDLERGRRIDAAMLRTAMETAFGASDATGAWDWKTAYDACEAATVLFLRKFAAAITAKATSPAAMLPLFTKIAGLLPTHTRRSEESQSFQQFSTPIPLGLAACTAAAITPADRVLEPSAGTGLLAILAELADGTLVLNELAETRAALLDHLFPGTAVTRFDAAQIDDHLDPAIVPSVVLMNPPFSAITHVDRRMADAALRHVTSALARLCGGGRLVAITGANFAPDNPAWTDAFERIERELDDNEQAQRRSQREQNGSEVKSVELEGLTAEGISLIERRNCMELFRDQAAERFEVQTGSPWRPRAGSLVSHRTLTAAMIDSRDFVAARRRADTELMLPAGPKIAFSGGLEFNDHQLIWERLDRVHAKHSDMVLLHGGSPKGAELIAAKWATQRKVPQIGFKPDWTKHAKAAPFKRNDAILASLPIGVMVFPGTGIQANLADKAKKLGIPVWKFGDEPAVARAKGGA